MKLVRNQKIEIGNETYIVITVFHNREEAVIKLIGTAKEETPVVEAPIEEETSVQSTSEQEVSSSIESAEGTAEPIRVDENLF